MQSLPFPFVPRVPLPPPPRYSGVAGWDEERVLDGVPDQGHYGECHQVRVDDESMHIFP